MNTPQKITVTLEVTEDAEARELNYALGNRRAPDSPAHLSCVRRGSGSLPM